MPAAMLETGTQRDKYLQELRQTELLIEYADAHGMPDEAARLRAKLRELAGRLD